MPWSKIRNIILQSAIADNPAVMTAGGWKVENNGKVVNKETEGTKQLQTILPIIGLTGLAGYTLAPLASSKALDVIDSTSSLLEGDYIGAAMNFLPADYVIKYGKKILDQNNLYKVVRSGLFHEKSKNPLSSYIPTQIYGVLEDIVPSSNRAAYLKKIDGEKEFLFGKSKGFSNVAELVQIKSDKDIALLTNGSSWKDLQINTPDEQLKIYKDALNGITKNTQAYKNYATKLNNYIKYIEDNKNTLQENYDRFHKLVQKHNIKSFHTDEIAKLLNTEDVGNLIFRDIDDGHVGDEIIMNTKIGYPKSIHGGKRVKNVINSHPLKLVIPTLIGLNQISYENNLQ